MDEAAKSGKRGGKTVPCAMEGRMCVPLAAGLAEVAIQRLNAIGIPAHVQQALRQLEVADAGAARELMDGFKTAVGRISFRMKQAFGYWKELPWALLVIMRPWVEYFSSSEEALSCEKECRTMALLLLRQHDATVNKAALGAACLPCFVSEKCHVYASV